MENKDISRQTLVVLVILAVAISLLGTFTVIKEFRDLPADYKQPTQTAQGKVSLTVVSPDAEPNNQATGRVAMNII